MPASNRRDGAMNLETPETRTSSRLALLLLLAVVLLPGASARPANPPVPPAGRATQPSGAVVYTCSMHPDVRLERPGRCPRCGMPLVAVPARLDSAAVLRFETRPPAIRAGQKVELRFAVSEPATGRPVRNFTPLHGMPFHLFLVSRDLEFYAHLHPRQQPDGEFVLETELPKSGRYELFCDFFPSGGVPQVAHRSLTTADAPAESADAPDLEPDRALVKSAGGIRFALAVQPERPVAGQTAVLRYSLADDRTGRPIRNLQPYLGAWAHAVSLREDASDFVHSHSTRFVPAADSGKGAVESRVSLSTFFARPGPHRVWSQFQREGRVVTVSFTIPVAPLDRLARRANGLWSFPAEPEGSGLDGAARALASAGTDLYVGGDFRRVGELAASGIAKWDGRRWSALAGGVNGSVWAIAARGRYLYAGGDFTRAGGRPARGVARWDGRAWRELGGGVGGGRENAAASVYALALVGSDLYVGGDFSTAGGTAASGIARWDGQAWHAVEGGVRTGIYPGVVRAFAARGGDLYAGGEFRTAGNATAYNVARWDGASWSALGEGIRGNLERVLALGIRGTDVYAGGIFSLAGGTSASNLARWDGKAWSPVSVEPRDGVWSLAVSGPRLYVGGASFTLPDGAAGRGIVGLEGGRWSDLGGGLGSGTHAGPILAIASTGPELYAGGEPFTLPPAGGSGGGGRPARREAIAGH